MKICISCGQRFDAADWLCPACGQTPERVDGFFAFAPGLARESDGFDAAFFKGLAEHEAGSFWFRARNSLLAWAKGRYFRGAGSFFEIGCGTGFVLSGLARAFPRMKLSGSEVFAAGLRFARERLPGVALFQMDARRIPFDREFDIVGAFDVLEHVDEDDVMLAEMRRAVKVGGGIMVTVPQHPALWSAADDYAHHRRRYTRAELVGKIERAGLTMRGITSFVSFLLPLMVASRLMRTRARVEADPLAELRTGHRLDRILEAVMGVELALIRRGVSLPAGGSLFAAASREDE